MAFDADLALQGWMAATIEIAKWRQRWAPARGWRPERPLRLLLAGYNGCRNTGADVRVQEIVRQLRHLFGDSQRLELSVLSIDPQQSAGYFDDAEQLRLPKVFPPFLARAVRQHDGVIACEGSMFKSKFASALSTMMIGALGLAVAEGKLAVAYGGEAGAMDPSLERLLKRYVGEALLIVRTPASQQKLAQLGLESKVGTDTAWTFQPRAPEQGEALLRRAGWDGRAPVLTLCPINPFWWPVKPELGKAVLRPITGKYGDSHYASMYFHRSGTDVEAQQQGYIAAIAAGLRRYQEQRAARGEAPVFPVIVGMEALDRRACEALRAAISAPLMVDGEEPAGGGSVAMFVADDFDMHALVSVLRRSSMLLSSRYHAVVTSMPAGVVSAGLTMDERLESLMADRGHPHLCLRVDEAELEHRIVDVLNALQADAVALRQGIEAAVVRNLRRMGSMGGWLVDAVQQRYPQFVWRDGLGSKGDPWHHLPPLAPALQRLVERSSLLSPTGPMNDLTA